VFSFLTLFAAPSSNCFTFFIERETSLSFSREFEAVALVFPLNVMQPPFVAFLLHDAVMILRPIINRMTPFPFPLNRTMPGHPGFSDFSFPLIFHPRSLLVSQFAIDKFLLSAPLYASPSSISNWIYRANLSRGLPLLDISFLFPNFAFFSDFLPDLFEDCP